MRRIFSSYQGYSSRYALIIQETLERISMSTIVIICKIQLIVLNVETGLVNAFIDISGGRPSVYLVVLISENCNISTCIIGQKNT